jgi:hypothetical protein
MKREHLLWAACAVAIWCIWLVWLWQPEHQLRLHQEHLRKAFAGRNWNRASNLVASDYSDRWGGSKSEMIGGAAGVLQHFVTLTIVADTRELSVADGRVVEGIRLIGQGSPLAEMAIDRVNSLASPFTFHWRRGSMPWDWQLTSIEQPELQVETGF